ncbi:unnamed protein product [Ixodes pacificus]
MNVNSASPNRMCDRPPPAREDTRTNEDTEYSRVLPFFLGRIQANQARLFNFASDDFYEEDSDDSDGEHHLSSLYTLSMGGGLMSRKYYFQLVSAATSPDNSGILSNDIYGIVKQQSGSTNTSQPESRMCLPSLLQQRECGMPCGGTFSRGDRCRIGSRLLPNYKMHTLNYPSKAFCGTFAGNGEVFMTACQDCMIRIYDTKQATFREVKSISARDVGWSILDMAVSPNGAHFVYSSWSEYLHLCNVFGDDEVHEALPLCPDDRRFCIFALQFSCDGNDILGGANDSCLYVYDREMHHRSLRVLGEQMGLKSRPRKSASGSWTIQITRGEGNICLAAKRQGSENQMGRKPATVRGDNHQKLSSARSTRSLRQAKKRETLLKFRALLLLHAMWVMYHTWWVRTQTSPSSQLAGPAWPSKLAGDTSLMTYQGHTVLQTLIRCHFSPAATTAQQFIYTGCASGRVVVYDLLTGKVATVLSGHRGCVRDVSWHPNLPVLVSSSWDGAICEWVYSSDPDSKKGRGKRTRSARQQ